jgi:AraC family transcriptional regulator, transcriptional activator of pobA
MKKYQPLVLQKLNIEVPGFHVRQVALHQHLPETTALQPHAHDYSQCLLYLSGQGNQEIGDDRHPVQGGAAVFLPPGVKHAFRREGNRRPICLVIDFDWRAARGKRAKVLPLPLSTLREVRQQLAGISNLERRKEGGPLLHMSALILRLLDLLLEGLALTQRPHAATLSPISRKVETLLESQESAGLTAGKLARLAGYQHDYLNRLLKNHAGLTLGQFRARKLVSRAQRLLQQTDSVADVANVVGFSDPNYFSRWFRKQTGMTPSQWRRNAPAGNS